MVAPLNRTSVGEILAEERFGRLLRRPEPEASISLATPGRDTNLPRAKVIGWDAWPERLENVRLPGRRSGRKRQIDVLVRGRIFGMADANLIVDCKRRRVTLASGSPRMPTSRLLRVR
jgi:hypothetical protein